MPVLELNKPFDSPDPKLVVQNRLAEGRHRFALVVVDERGRVSAADQVVVTVQPRAVPPVVPPVRPPVRPPIRPPIRPRPP